MENLRYGIVKGSRKVWLETIASKVPESCLHTSERIFILYTCHCLFYVAQEGKIRISGLWEGNLACIRISRSVAYMPQRVQETLLASFLKFYFRIVSDLQKGWGKKTQKPKYRGFMNTLHLNSVPNRSTISKP